MSQPSSPVLKARRQTHRLYSKMLYCILALCSAIWFTRAVLQQMGLSYRMRRTSIAPLPAALNVYNSDTAFLVTMDTGSAPSNTTSLTLILPITAASLLDLDSHVSIFLQAAHSVDQVVLLSSRSYHPHLKKCLRAMLSRTDYVDLEFIIEQWPEGMQESVAVLQVAQRTSTDWVLLLDDKGLLGLDQATRDILLLSASPPASLPLGPRGLQYHLDGVSCVTPSSLQHTAYLIPPLVLPVTMLPTRSNAWLSRDPWSILGDHVSRSGGGPGGLVVGSPDPNPAWCRRYTPRDSDGSLLPVYTSTGSFVNEQHNHAQQHFNDNSEVPPASGTFLMVLDGVDASHVIPLACGLVRRGHRVSTHILQGVKDISKTALTALDDCGCSLLLGSSSELSTSVQYYDALYSQLRDKIDVIISSVSDDVSPPSLTFFLKELANSSHFVSDIHIPREDLVYCDWMAAIGIEGWQNWHIPDIELSVVTDNRPHSLRRLLSSLSSARFFGDVVNLRINTEQTADKETLRIVSAYEWDHGDVFLHHRVVHGGLMTSIVESWFPKDNNTYGLILEDDVELSPLFYAWAKSTLLRYRYGRSEDRSPNLFGISLYQQKNLELHPEGRHLFDARSTFTSAGLPHPDTPYLSQIPCSWGALYFPEHWREFHEYLVARLASLAFPISEHVVPAVRSNRWTSSWKRFFIELVFLRGYVMLYPNYAGYMSLSTNHLETGSHVKEMPVEAYLRKKKLFNVPLMPLPIVPEDSVGGLATRTSLLDLPHSRWPAWNELPVLDLLGTILDETDLTRRGRERRMELTGCDGLLTEAYDVRELLCITMIPGP